MNVHPPIPPQGATMFQQGYDQDFLWCSDVRSMHEMHSVSSEINSTKFRASSSVE